MNLSPKKKIVSILVSIMLLVSIIAFGTVYALRRARTPVVTNIDTGETFSTIQAAINSVNTIAGHTIEAGKGKYYEYVKVNKTITLRSAIKHKAIVYGLIWIAVDDVIVEGFQVRMATTPKSLEWIYAFGGISVRNVDNVTVRNNKVNGLGSPTYWSDGIYLWRCHYIMVENNYVRNAPSVGIDVEISDNCTIKDNRIKNSEFYGIGLTPTSTPTIGGYCQEILVVGNHIQKTGVGIFLQGGHDCILYDNRVKDSTWSGINVESVPGLGAFAYDNVIIRNRVSRSLNFDLHDETSGGRTAGTANWWIDNKGKTESPTGLMD